MPDSICSRRRDLVYLVFFTIHAPIIFLIDAAPLLPSFLQVDLSRQLREYYVNAYHDRFFEAPAPAWFATFISMEVFYHAPLSVWAVGALLRDDPLIPIHLLIFGVQSFVTSLPCLVEVWAWTDRTVTEKQNLSMLYAPYVALGAFMAVDMFFRLCGRISLKSKSE